MGKLSKAAQKIAATIEKNAGKAEKMSKEAAEALLKRINTVEAATALKGAEKQEYLNALDLVYGDRQKRATDLGFSPETYYHGTGPSSNIEKFDANKLGSHTGEGVTKDRFWFSDKPEVAEYFANSATNVEALKNLDSKNSPLFKEQDTLLNLLSEELKGSDLNLDKLIKDPSGLKTFVKYGDLTQEQADKIKRISDIDDTLKQSRLNLRSELKDTSGQIMPVRLRTKGMQEIDMGGKTWQQSGADIPEKGVILKNFYEDAGEDVGVPMGTSVGTYNPSKIRSTNAAFDPRFKDSPNILALNGSQKPNMGLPVSDGLKSVAKNISDKYLVPAFNDYVVKPAVAGYENVVKPVFETVDKVNEATGRNEAARQIGSAAASVVENAPGALDRLVAPIEQLYKTPEQMQAVAQKSAEGAKFARENISPEIKQVAMDWLPDASGPLMNVAGKVVKMAGKAAKPGVKIAEKMSTAERLASKKADEIIVLGNRKITPDSFGTVTNASPMPNKSLGKVTVVDTTPKNNTNVGTVTVRDSSGKMGWTQTPDIAADVYKKTVEQGESFRKAKKENLDQVMERYKQVGYTIPKKD